MPSDNLVLAAGDGSRRMTYAELADVRRISVESAERLVRRRKWPRQVGNDGVVRILVPLKEARNTTPKPRRVRRGYPTPDIRGQSGTVSADNRLLERALDELSAQLAHERQRADRAELRVDEAIARADRAEKRIDELLARQPTPDSPPAVVQPPADAGSPSILVQRISDAPLGLNVPDSPQRRRWWRFGR